MILKKSSPGTSRSIAAYLRRGGLITYPTEYCYGLGCDPRNRRAVQKVLKLKQRPQHKGLTLIAGKFRQIAPYLDIIQPQPPNTATNYSAARYWYCRATRATEKIIHNSWIGKW